jgi:hypothetical protein
LFVWRQEQKIVAFWLCMVHRKAIYSEYLGLDYDVALEVHLYFHMHKDVLTWAIANGIQCFKSSGLNYDPKLRMGSLLDPLDLYVKHTSDVINTVLKRILPLLEPTRHDQVLRRFVNYGDLWGLPKPPSGVGNQSPVADPLRRRD